MKQNACMSMTEILPFNVLSRLFASIGIDAQAYDVDELLKPMLEDGKCYVLRHDGNAVTCILDTGEHINGDAISSILTLNKILVTCKQFVVFDAIRYNRYKLLQIENKFYSSSSDELKIYVDLYGN